MLLCAPAMPSLEFNFGAWPSQVLKKLLSGNMRLFQNAAQGANGQLRVQRHNATNLPLGRLPFEDHVAASLPDLDKAESLKGADRLLPRYPA